MVIQSVATPPVASPTVVTPPMPKASLMSPKVTAQKPEFQTPANRNPVFPNIEDERFGRYKDYRNGEKDLFLA